MRNKSATCASNKSDNCVGTPNSKNMGGRDEIKDIHKMQESLNRLKDHNLTLSKKVASLKEKVDN